MFVADFSKIKICKFFLDKSRVQTYINVVIDIPTKLTLIEPQIFYKYTEKFINKRERNAKS